jgi:hypothetical protein
VAGRRRHQGRHRSYGATDELGYNAVENPVHVHDLHATMLHQLGIDHGGLGSVITGRLGALKVAGDFTDASLDVTGGADGQIGSVFIGGDLTAGANFSGRVASSGAMGDVRIGGSLTGGAGGNSGQVFGNGALGDVRIGGGVTGGAGADSGQVFSGGTMGDVRIGGGLIGGAGNGSGRVFSLGAMGDVRIGGDLIGGSITGTASLSDSGEIRSGGRIASVTIGGSLVAGTNASTGTLTNSGAILAGDDLGPVKVRSSIIGNSSNPALIIARGREVKPVTGFDVAIASLNVRGDVRFARILAGFNFGQNPANADASIGAVIVRRDWAASSIVAGAQDTGAAGFGIGDTLQTVNDTALVARIASITIKGDATGSLIAGDHFGFVAQQIDKLRIGSRSFALTAGSSNDSFAIPFTNDLRLLEVA